MDDKDNPRTELSDSSGESPGDLKAAPRGGRLSRASAYASLLTALATLILVAPAMVGTRAEVQKSRADVAKISGELKLLETQRAALEAQARSLNLSSAQLAPSFDYQYLTVLAETDPPFDFEPIKKSAARSWSAPIASPSFDAGGVAPEGSGSGVEIDQQEQLGDFIKSSECKCPTLRSDLQSPGVEYKVLKSTYLGVAQLGKSPALDVRMKLRKFDVGELNFYSLEDAQEALRDPGPTIEVLVGTLDTGEARLVPLFASVSVLSPRDDPYQGTVGVAYLPVSISWRPPGQDEPVVEEIRGALASPVLVEGGIEARG